MKNIVLEGFMGVGKTTIGKALADELQFDFLDTDTEVEKQAGKSIHDMLVDGELTQVRAWETRVCQELAQKERVVIATGGGVFTKEENAKIFRKKGFVVCLERPFEQIYPLISNDPIRVLAYGKSYEEMKNLLDSRIPSYHRFADLIIDNNQDINKTVHTIIGAFQSSIRKEGEE